MNFIILLLALTVSTLSHANSNNFLELIKRDVTYDEEAFLNNLSEKCRAEYKDSYYYNKCMPDITLANYKNSCSDVDSEKCQDFFDDPLKYFPSCKDIPEFVDSFQPTLMKTLKQNNAVFCQTNEKGELCPYSLALMTNGGGVAVLRDQCKSKKCTESLIKIFNDINIDQFTAYENSTYTTGSFNYNELNAFKQLVSFLESKQCQSQHATSNASYVKTNASLLISLLLLLLF